MLLKIKIITVEPLFKKYKKLEAEIQGLLHPTQINLEYFLAWFQSLQLPSTQSESPFALAQLTACSVDCLQDSSSARTPRKTPSPIVKNAYLLVRYPAMDICEPHRKHFL
jgi:hypothetical protein